MLCGVAGLKLGLEGNISSHIDGNEQDIQQRPGGKEMYGSL